MSQLGSLLVSCHTQFGSADSPKSPSPPSAGKLVWPGDSPVTQVFGVGGWVTLKSLPPKATCPVRVIGVGLPAARIVIAPFPLPMLPLVMLSQFAKGTARHVHPAAAVMDADTDPPECVTVADVADSGSTQIRMATGIVTLGAVPLGTLAVIVVEPWASGATVPITGVTGFTRATPIADDDHATTAPETTAPEELRAVATSSVDSYGAIANDAGVTVNVCTTGGSTPVTEKSSKVEMASY